MLFNWTKELCSLLIFFFLEYRKGIILQIYLRDFTQSPAFAERITWPSHSCWKSALSAAAAPWQWPPGAIVILPAQPCKVIPEQALGVSGRSLDKKGLCGSTEVLSAPGHGSQRAEPGCGRRKHPALPPRLSPAPLHRWCVVERGTSPKRQANSRSQCRSQNRQFCYHPVTAGEQSCHDAFQGNSQFNSLKSSLLAASHTSLQHPLISPATSQKFTQQLNLKKYKKYRKRKKKKHKQSSPPIKADLQLVNQRSFTAQ